MSAIPSMSGRALIAAGGTGGHVYPALAVAGLLTEQGWSVDWVGTERGIEQRLVPAAGLPLHHLSVSGLRGKNWVARVQGAVRLIAALWQSLSLMWRVKPDVVLGMGGYAAGPAGLAPIAGWRRWRDGCCVDCRADLPQAARQKWSGIQFARR